MPSLGVVTHVFEEARALPGFLESAARFFDEIVVYHTGPGGAYSTDGTIEIAERFGARVEYGDIHAGFGVVRSQAVRLSSCAWVAILDADERLYPVLSVLECDGSERYPAQANPTLTVRDTGLTFHHAAFLRERISDPSVDAVCAIRRHWFGMSGSRPAQNWREHPDHQLRILRNGGHVGYREYPKMHEQCVDFRTGLSPRFAPPHPQFGPIFDHYHLLFKNMEPEQRAADIALYDALHSDSVPAGDCNRQ